MESVQYCPITVGNIIRREEILSELKLPVDFVYSAGLFDYLSQPVAKTLVERLSGWLKSDGQMIIGNFNYGYPQTISDFTGDWKLICRSDDEMLDLTKGIDAGRVDLSRDEVGIETFLEISEVKNTSIKTA